MKFYGKIGFWDDTVEVKPGVFKPQIVEKDYYGDMIKDYRSVQTRSDEQYDDLTLGNRLIILADIYMRENLASVKYVLWNDVKWKVTHVDVEYPRLTLSLGGVYNENTIRAS